MPTGAQAAGSGPGSGCVAPADAGPAAWLVRWRWTAPAMDSRLHSSALVQLHAQSGAAATCSCQAPARRAVSDERQRTQALKRAAGTHRKSRPGGDRRRDAACPGPCASLAAPAADANMATSACGQATARIGRCVQGGNALRSRQRQLMHAHARPIISLGAHCSMSEMLLVRPAPCTGCMQQQDAAAHQAMCCSRRRHPAPCCSCSLRRQWCSSTPAGASARSPGLSAEKAAGRRVMRHLACVNATCSCSTPRQRRPPRLQHAIHLSRLHVGVGCAGPRRLQRRRHGQVQSGGTACWLLPCAVQPLRRSAYVAHGDSVEVPQQPRRVCWTRASAHLSGTRPPLSTRHPWAAR